MRSVTVVLPASICAMIPIFRMLFSFRAMILPNSAFCTALPRCRRGNRDADGIVCWKAAVSFWLVDWI